MQIKNLPLDLQFGFKEIEKYFPHLFNLSKLLIKFQKSISKNRELKIYEDGGVINIHYSEKVDAFRGFVLYQTLQNSKKFSSKKINESCPHKMNGSMLDVSRNAVYTIDALKKILVIHALLGLNMLILYTEDTFEVPGEPFFGYMRGKYTKKEIKEIDRFAIQLGIEMFPCIQTLGHFEQVLQWPIYRNLRDTDGILLASEDKSMHFIEKIIEAASSAFQSKRIHLGMDEAIGIGSGFYRDKYGAKEPFEILSKHLKKVSAICQSKGLQPMIWSDMYFRLGSKNGDYYDLKSKIPKNIIADIPKDLQMVYWDYYHKDKEFYSQFIQCHKQLKRDVIMATGIWTWSRFWAASPFTFKALGACMTACRQEKVAEVFATLWRDDGSECVEESSLPGYIFYAESCFNDSIDEGKIKAVFQMLFAGKWDDYMLANKLDYVNQAKVTEFNTPNISKLLLWEDPILGHMQGDRNGLSLNNYYQKLYLQLLQASKKKGYNEYLIFPAKLAKVLSIKADLNRQIKDAVIKKNKVFLRGKALKLIIELRKSIQSLCAEHRKVWHRNYKPFGFEILETRYGGLLIRIDALELLIKQFLRTSIIPDEFLENTPPVYPEGLKHAYTYRRSFSPAHLWTGFNY